MGTVYRARDVELGTTVALKTISGDANAVDLMRFKREFRALADVRHPNLIALGELGDEQGVLYYTMELVEGLDLLKWIRAVDTDSDAPTVERAPSMHTDHTIVGELDSVSSPPPPSTDLRVALARPQLFIAERLRSGIAQLFAALRAIHGAGLVHRDVKPHNILVREDGRVVLLDFGLVREVVQELGGQGVTADQGGVLGTVAYMAPEQATGGSIGPAVDAYAAGVILYEALVGQRPFSGHALQVLHHKQTTDPTPPSSLRGGLPADLEELCLALLSRDPALRPSDDEVLRRLGDGEGVITERSGVGSAAPTGSDASPVFIGRARELAELDDGRHTVAESGEPVVMIVEGESGIGKTAMVRRFLERTFAARDDLVVFARCYERESVPFKGIDAVIDGLATWLARAGPTTAAAMVPPRAHELVRAFPVLGRVPAIRNAPPDVTDVNDPQERRARVFAAARALFGRLCARCRVVVTIDDLQWADDDSLALLAEVLRPPSAPPLLVVATVRGGTDAARLTRALGGRDLARIDVRRVAVERLSRDDARALARALLEEGVGGPAPDLERPIDEAGGHPLFLRELLRQGRSDDRATTPRTLDELIRARAREVSEGARALLDLVVLAPAPIDEELAAAALGVSRADVATCLIELQGAQLIRSTPVNNRPLLEPWHARMREALRGDLDAGERRRVLLALAAVLEGRDRDDAAEETLYQTFREAGDVERARGHAERAGDRALSALAFDHAARLFGAALEGVVDVGARRRLLVRLGDAHGGLGRGRAAATAYLDAAGDERSTAATELRRRAAEQLLRAGHFEDGKTVLAKVLDAFSLSLPSSAPATVLSLIAAEAKNRLRGLSFRARAVEEIAAGDLRRIDVCWTAAMGLAGKDNLGSAYFQARHLSFALAAGERYRISRALSLQAGFSALSGDKGRASALAQLSRARDLAIESGHPHASALNRWMSGFVDFMSGRFEDCVKQCEEADAMAGETCPDATWERSNCHVYIVSALAMTGALEEVARKLPAFASEAEARGDVYEIANLPLGPMALVWMARDDVAGARAAIDDGIRRWAALSVTNEDLAAVVAHGLLDLYEGDGARAVQRVDDLWDRRGMFARVAHNTASLREVRARGHVLQAALSSGADRARHLRAATVDVKALALVSLPWAAPAALLLRASIAHLEGAEATSLLRAASSDLYRSGLQLHAAVARRALGTMMSGAEGRRLVDDAEAWLAARGIRKVAPLASAIAPGLA